MLNVQSVKDRKHKEQKCKDKSVQNKCGKVEG